MNVQIIQKIWAFGHTENKHTLYRGKDCMKRFCESLREHGKNIIGFKRKESDYKY